MVTKRIKPMTIDGKKVYQIGLPFIKAIAVSPRTKVKTRGRWRICSPRRSLIPTLTRRNSRLPGEARESVEDAMSRNTAHPENLRSRRDRSRQDAQREIYGLQTHRHHDVHWL